VRSPDEPPFLHQLEHLLDRGFELSFQFVRGITALVRLL